MFVWGIYTLEIVEQCGEAVGNSGGPRHPLLVCSCDSAWQVWVDAVERAHYFVHK
jgi:hypothetical protein